MGLVRAGPTPSHSEGIDRGRIFYLYLLDPPAEARQPDIGLNEMEGADDGFRK